MQALHDRVSTVLEDTHLFKKSCTVKVEEQIFPLTDTASHFVIQNSNAFFLFFFLEQPMFLKVDQENPHENVQSSRH